MVATPVTVYHYDVLGLKGQPIATSNVSVPEAPCYTVMSVEDYNASAELLGNPVIDNRSVVGVVPGQPQTYPSSKWQINSVGGVTVPFDTPVLAAQGNAVISQEVSWEDSQTLTKSYSHNVDPPDPSPSRPANVTFPPAATVPHTPLSFSPMWNPRTTNL